MTNILCAHHKSASSHETAAGTHKTDKHTHTQTNTNEHTHKLIRIHTRAARYTTEKQRGRQQIRDTIAVRYERIFVCVTAYICVCVAGQRIKSNAKALNNKQGVKRGQSEASFEVAAWTSEASEQEAAPQKGAHKTPVEKAELEPKPEREPDEE